MPPSTSSGLAKCGAEMQIKAFVTDPAEVKRLLDNLGIQGWMQPVAVKATSPPGEVELLPAEAQVFSEFDDLQYAGEGYDV